MDMSRLFSDTCSRERWFVGRAMAERSGSGKSDRHPMTGLQREGRLLVNTGYTDSRTRMKYAVIERQP
jgi:hypothetical protein